MAIAFFRICTIRVHHSRTIICDAIRELCALIIFSQYGRQLEPGARIQRESSSTHHHASCEEPW